MSTTTTNYGLIKPALTDAADITAMNPNWDKIDNELKAVRQAVSITSGNLNNYVDVGMYVYSASNSTSIVNTPEQVQSTLLVIPRLLPDDSTNRVQMVLTQTNHLYLRNLAEGNWGSWERLRNSTEVIPVVYGGTGTTDITGIRQTINLPPTCVTIEDWNNAVQTGWYMGNNATNSPTSGSNIWYFGFVIAHNSNYVLQEVYQFTASSDAKSIPKYIRACKEGVWGVWSKVTVQRDVPYDAKLDYIKTLTGDAQTQLNNKMSAKPTCIELDPGASATTGGYVDFHYAGSTEDYTSRIIEDTLGHLRIIAQNGVLVPSIDPATKSLRNIQAGTTDLTAGSSTLETGMLYCVYE